jgi:hypothetical protein
VEIIPQRQTSTLGIPRLDRLAAFKYHSGNLSITAECESEMFMKEPDWEQLNETLREKVKQAEAEKLEKIKECLDYAQREWAKCGTGDDACRALVVTDLMQCVQGIGITAGNRLLRIQVKDGIYELVVS